MGTLCKKAFFYLSSMAAVTFTACHSAPSHLGFKDTKPSSSPSELQGFDVNDVSFLFPKIAGVNEASPIITGEDLTSDGSAFIPELVFGQIMEFSDKILPANLRENSKLRASWRVQSFRFDPCAPSGAEFRSLSFVEMATGQAKSDCHVEIRTIMQPMEPLGVFAGSGHVADVAMHLTYHLATGSHSEELRRLVDELKALKQQSETLSGGQTSGAALGRHPGLYAELNSGAVQRPLADAVKSFLQRNLNDRQLRRVTFSELDARTGTGWIFFGGDVSIRNDMAVWTPAHVFYEPTAQSIEFRPDNVLKTMPVILPLPSSVSTNSLYTSGSVGRGVAINPSFGVGAAGRTMPISEAQETINLLEDPTKTNIFNTDCVSCHTSTARAFTLGIPATGLADRPRGITAYAFAPAFTLSDIRQRRNTDGLQSNVWNVRNFGWFDWQATASNRTVNEAMASALYINGLFFNGKSPGLDCVEADHDGAVASCVLEGRGADCFKLCAGVPR